MILVVQGVPFGFADLLDHHLLGGLCANAADGFFRIQGDAVVGSADRAVFAVDVNDDVFFLAILFFGGGDERGFDSFEDDLLVDVLIAMDCIDDPQNLVWIHKSLSFRSVIQLTERFRIVGPVAAGMSDPSAPPGPDSAAIAAQRRTAPEAPAPGRCRT